MAITETDVRVMLGAEEPDWEALAQIGPDMLPHLQRLVQGSDLNLAAKAAYLAGRIGDPRSVPVLTAAAANAHPAVRVGAAAGARFRPPGQADSVLLTLLDDPRAGVRKTALQAVPPRPSAALASKVAALGATEPVAGIRKLAGDIAARG